MSEANMFQTSQDPNNPTDNNQEQQQQQQTRFFGAGFPGSPMAQSFQDQSGFMASSPVQSRFMNADRNWLDLPPPQQQMASSWHGGQPGSPGQFQATFMETITYPPNGSFDRFYTYNAAPQNDTRDLNLPSGIELPSNSGPSSPGYGAPPTMFLQHYSTFGTAPRFALNAQTNEAQQQQSGAPAEQSNEQTDKQQQMLQQTAPAEFSADGSTMMANPNMRITPTPVALSPEAPISLHGRFVCSTPTEPPNVFFPANNISWELNSCTPIGQQHFSFSTLVGQNTLPSSPSKTNEYPPFLSSGELEGVSAVKDENQQRTLNN